MRLAVVTHNIVKGDGQGRANYEIVRYALSQGASVTLIADKVAPEIIELGAKVHFINPSRRGGWLRHGWEFSRRADRLLKKMDGEFDVIHGYGHTLRVPHQVNTSQFVHSAWRQSPVHVSRGRYDINGRYQWLYSYLNAKWERISYANAQRVVAASHTVYDELQAIGVPKNRLEVILNGADPAEFYPGAVDRNALGLPTETVLGLFAGDIKSSRKNLDTVLKAIAKVPTIHLAVAGKVAGSPFPAMAQSLGIADRVHFLDFRRDIADLMRASDLFIFPSRYEACALVLVEAIASGLPVITAETTGGSEVVTDDAGIRLPNPNDADALAAAIQTMASASGEKRRAMSAAAHRESQKYTWTHIAEAYMEVYKRFV